MGAATRPPLVALQDEIVACERCPRLVEWTRQVAVEKRAAYRDDDYWGRPVPSFGDPHARLLIVGLAPGAHGANRTGRMFTGDRSGDWLYRALHRAGFADRPESVWRDDGLTLTGAWITAAVHCAPPANRPTPTECATCRPWLERELELMAPQLACIVALGGLAWTQLLGALGSAGWDVATPRPRFGHGAETQVRRPRAVADGAVHVLGSYHPSQQNTFTGRLTEEMFDTVWSRARTLVER